MNANIKCIPCSLSEVYDFVRLNHYSHSCTSPGLASHCFAATEGGMLVGAAVFGHSSGNAKTGSIFKAPFDTKEYCRELLRFVMCDNPLMPHCNETQFLGACLQNLRRRLVSGYSTIRGLVSYADPEHQHSGIIYRASNWLYTGLSNPTRKLIVDGMEIHPRRASNLYRTHSVTKIQAMGHMVELRETQQKHRYIYLLDRSMLPFVKYSILDYGRRRKNECSSAQDQRDAMAARRRDPVMAGHRANACSTGKIRIIPSLYRGS